MTGMSGDPLRDLNPDMPEHLAFMRVRLREGYAKRQVDAFVDQAVQALEAPGLTMRPEDVRAVRFTPVRMRVGYDMREVDAFLDDVEAQLAARHGDPQRERPCPSPVAHTGTAQAWAARLRAAVLLLVFVIWVYAELFAKT